MLKVGITGGIGSGKTIVCKVFETMGIPVFYADDAAKELMNSDAELKQKIQSVFGNSIYAHGRLQRQKLAAIIFEDRAKLATLNALVHPATIAYAEGWFAKQRCVYAIKEAAIFFESGADKGIDIMIGVDAPETLRIKRALSRGGITIADIKQRIAGQMENTQKMRLCQFVITNDDIMPVLPQVLAIHQQLLKLAVSH